MIYTGLLELVSNAYDEAGLSTRYQFIDEKTEAVADLPLELLTSFSDVQERVRSPAPFEHNIRKNLNFCPDRSANADGVTGR